MSLYILFLISTIIKTEQKKTLLALYFSLFTSLLSLYHYFPYYPYCSIHSDRRSLIGIYAFFFYHSYFLCITLIFAIYIVLVYYYYHRRLLFFFHHSLNFIFILYIRSIVLHKTFFCIYNYTSHLHINFFIRYLVSFLCRWFFIFSNSFPFFFD